MQIDSQLNEYILQLWPDGHSISSGGLVIRRTGTAGAFQSSLAWQMTTHPESDCLRLRLKLFSAAPPREGEKCVNCPDGGNRCSLQSPKRKALLSSHVEGFSPLSVASHSRSKTTLKRLQYYFQCFLVSQLFTVIFKNTHSLPCREGEKYIMLLRQKTGEQKTCV